MKPLLFALCVVFAFGGVGAVKGGVKGSQCGGVKVVQWKVMDLRGGWRLERSGRRHPPRSAFGGWLLGLGC